MTAMGVDHKLQRLREAAQRISDNLLELETDPVRLALQGAELAGETAARRQAADAGVAQLWECYGALDRLLDRATALRGTRARPSAAQLAELGALLDGPAIELETQAVPLEQRALLGTAQRTTRCTPVELLERMSATFDEAKAVVAAVGSAWSAGRARLSAALAATTALPGREERDRLRAQLAELDARLASDPLSVDLAELDAIDAAVARAVAAAESVAALRAGLPDRIEEARALLGAADREEREARLAHAELTAKIVAPHVAAPDRTATRGDRDLDAVAELAAGEAWDEAAARLDACVAGARERLDRAREVRAACGAPIEERNRMRGLLDAYLGKAHGLGRIEDRELAALYAAARDALHTAPTDLEQAGTLVRRYQEALR